METGHNGIRLETARLILRSMTAQDAPAMYAGWFSDPEVTRYLTFPAHTSVEQTRAFVEQAFVYDPGSPNLYLGIELRETGQLVGSMSIKDEGHGTGAIGYSFAKSAWGKGIATESCRELIRFAFEEKGYRRVMANHSDNNMASGRVLQKCGLKQEGYVRGEYVASLGDAQNCYIYGLTAEEYFGKLDIGFDELVKRASHVVGRRTLTDFSDCGSVSAAILTDKNNIYTGICIDISCNIGFCAEHSAAAAMLQAGESRVVKLVAINAQGHILPPCGRCRELITSLHEDNADTQVLVAKDTVVPMRELMPYDWKQAKKVDGTEPIVSARLKLMPIAPSHAQPIFEHFTPDVTTYMFPPPATKLEHSLGFVEKSIENRAVGKEFVYAITLAETGEFLGCCGIHNISSKKPELGIWTKTDAHGHGYGLETISALLAYVRQHLAYDYIVYPVDKRNHASRRIPILFGGTVAKEYEVQAMSGNTLQIVEYHLQ